MSSRIILKKLMDFSGVAFGTSGLRGLVVKMTDELCYMSTVAFLEALAGDKKTEKKVVLGHDFRPSSPRIASACAKAISDSGYEVIYSGSLPTPALALYAYENQLPAIVVTGSHIPFDRNGIKFYKSSGEISKEDESLILNRVINKPSASLIFTKDLPLTNLEVRTHYIQRYIEFFQNSGIHGLRIAIYEHSSVARDILSEILKALGAEVISLGRSDGFVPIDTEAVRAEDVAQAAYWAKQQRFDAIISTDGDADRPLIGDENGQWLRGDVVGALTAKFLDSEAVVTPVSSNTIVEKSGWFKTVVRTKIGSPYVIDAMNAFDTDRQTVVGYEANGGVLLGSKIRREDVMLGALPTRDAVLPILSILAMAMQQRCKLSQLLQLLPNRFTASNRLEKISTEQSKSLVAELRNSERAIFDLMSSVSGSVASINYIDGVRVTFENGDIVHIRPSGNAPELRCYAEADTQQKADRLCNDCLDKISLRSSKIYE